MNAEVDEDCRRPMTDDVAPAVAHCLIRKRERTFECYQCRLFHPGTMASERGEGLLKFYIRMSDKTRNHHTMNLKESPRKPASTLKSDSPVEVTAIYADARRMTPTREPPKNGFPEKKDRRYLSIDQPLCGLRPSPVPVPESENTISSALIGRPSCRISSRDNSWNKTLFSGILTHVANCRVARGPV